MGQTVCCTLDNNEYASNGLRNAHRGQNGGNVGRLPSLPTFGNDPIVGQVVYEYLEERQNDNSSDGRGSRGSDSEDDDGFNRADTEPEELNYKNESMVLRMSKKSKDPADRSRSLLHKN